MTTKLPARDLAQVAVFAALIGVASLPGGFTVLGSQVPITAQTLAVMLAGAVLGARKGLFAVLLYLALIAVGLPIAAGGAGGPSVFQGPSAGYLIGFAAGAFVIGLIVQRFLPNLSPLEAFLACVVGGIVVVYAVGVPWLAWRLNLDLRTAFKTGAWVFLPGDLLKAVLAAAVASGVHRAYPSLADERTREPAAAEH